MSDGVKNAEKIRVLVLGDSGVGKTSLIELVCSGEELRKPRSTVGCAIHMKIHESRATVSLSCLCACTSEVIGVVCAWWPHILHLTHPLVFRMEGTALLNFGTSGAQSDSKRADT